MVNTMFILDRTLNTSHILTANKNSRSAFWEDTYTQEFDTGAESLEFSCYAHEGVKEGNYVAFFYNSQYKMFQITEVEEVHKNGRLVAECYCETASLQLLNNYVRPFSGDMNCVQFFEYILNGTEWRIGKYSNSLKDKVLTINESSTESVWSLIEDYKDLFECEINTYITYENGHVTGQFIDIFSEKGLGAATYKRFEYGKNVTGITKSKDLYDWCTAIIVDCNCDVTNTVINENQGYGFSKGAGDVILDDNHNRMYNAGRNHVLGVYSGDETEPVEACINAWKELEKRSVPKFDYQVTTALKDEEYDEIHLGDTVYVVDHSYTPPLLLEARVGKLELSFTDRSANKCTLTNYKEIKSKLLDADYIKLTGTITDIVNAFFPITSEGIADGAICEGKIETTYFQQITADIVSASVGAFENLYVQGMTVINADIEKLNATAADITELKAQVADIDTLINGHLTSDNIQSLILTADKVTVADAFIKDAMIDSVTADKITSGSINTNNVYIGSEDGSMIINGSLQQFKDKDGNVRIQIGKDAQGDFTFSLFDENGSGVLIDEKGITENAIADGLIVNDMVAENAGIAGSKLDIDSVVTEINNGATTIKGTKVVLDETNQTLNVAFNSLETKIDDIEIGGTNLLPKTKEFDGIEYGASKVVEKYKDFTVRGGTKTHTSIFPLADIYFPSGNFNYGDVFTFSFYARATGEHMIRAYFYGDSGYTMVKRLASNGSETDKFTQYNDGNTRFLNINNEWKRYWVTWEINTTGDLNVNKKIVLRDEGTGTGYQIYTCGWKLERGNKPTDWSPNPQDVEDKITSNTTAINVQQGQIDTLISNTTITKENGEVVQLKDEYNSTKDTVDSHTTKIGSLETTVNTVSSKQASMELDLGGFRTEVSNTYATKSEVQDAGEGNDNLIVNGRFLGAEPKMAGVALDPWYMWGKIQVYRDGAYDGINKNLTLQMTSESEGNGGIYQNLSDDVGRKPPQNTKVTASFYCDWQQNVQPPYFALEYYLNNVQVNNVIYTITKGDNVITFTTYNGDYDRLAIVFNSKGLVAGANGSYVNWYLNKVKVELGDKATPWSENPHYIENTYTTQTKFQQTTEDFTFKVQQAGGYNLIKNSAGAGGTNLWTAWNIEEFSVRTSTTPEIIATTGKYFGIKNTSLSNEGYAYSPRFKLKPNTTYRLSMWVRTQANVIETDIYALTSDSLYEDSTDYYTYSHVHELWLTVNTGGAWRYLTKTFTTASGTKSGYIRVDHDGITHDTGSDVYVHWGGMVLTEGELEMPWSPHPSEIYDGIVKIDKNGLTVQHANNKSVLDSEALQFYAGDTRYSRIKGGKFEFTNNDGSVIGDIGRSTWVGTNTGISSVNARYGHSVSLGAQYDSTGGNYSSSLTVCSKDGQLSSSGGYYFQGLNLSRPKVSGPLILRGSAEDTIDLNLQGMMLFANYGNGYRTGYIFGNEEVHIGTQYGTENWDGLIIKENAANNSKNELHVYGHLDMHNYNISRAGWVNPVSATSTYTTRLLNEGSIENMTYGGTTFTEGELRYVHRETCHTVEEWDYNDEGVWSPLGVYYCYCELPVFMAENIELDYHVNIGKVGWGDYRVIEKNPYLFIVESQEEGFAFTWEVVAKQVEKATNNTVVANEYVNTGRSQPIPTEDNEFTYELDKEDNIQDDIITGEE